MNDRNSFSERRRQADWVIKAAIILSVVAWVVAFAALLIIEIAAPQQMDAVTYIVGGTVRDTWEVAMLPAAFVLLIGSVLSCIAAFVFNAMRMRRKTDKYRKSIIIIGILSIIGLVAFTLRFNSYLF